MDKAQGVFIWVRLAIRSLLRGITNRDNENILKRRLEELPGDIDKLYTFMLSRQNDDWPYYKDSAALYFNLVIQREVSLLEFCLAIKDEVRERLLNPILAWNTRNLDEDFRCEDVIAWINARCAGLLEIDDIDGYQPDLRPLTAYGNEKVQFIHQTARTYLMDTKNGMELRSICPKASNDLTALQFESAFVYEYILFALCQHKIGFAGGTARLRDPGSSERFPTGEPRSDFHSKAEPMWSELMKRDCFRRDLYHLPGMRRSTEHWDAFPRLKDDSIDYPALYCELGWKRHALKAFAINVAEVSDVAYPSRLLLWVANLYRLAGIYHRHDMLGIIPELLEILLEAGADPHVQVELPHGELVTVSSLLTAFVPSELWSTHPEYNQRIMKTPLRIVDMSVPTIPCCDRTFISLSDHLSISVSLWGDFRLWGQVRPLDFIGSADDAALFTARLYDLCLPGCESDRSQLFRVSSANSEKLLRCLRDACNKTHPSRHRVWAALGILNLPGDLSKSPPLIDFIETLRDEVMPFTSLGEALLFMGKDDKHIMQYANLQEQDLRRNGESGIRISNWKARFFGLH